MSCSKETIEAILEPSPYWGTISVLQNGLSWSAEPYAYITVNQNNSLGVKADVLNVNGIRKESISFIKIPFSLGTYPVVNTDARDDDGLVGAGFWHVDHDVIHSSYKILESDSSSFVTLTNYDTISQEIRGHFDLTLALLHKKIR